MLKRIEVYYNEEPEWTGCVGPLMRTGLLHLLSAPKKKKRNGLFYFTKKGFEKFGIPTINQIEEQIEDGIISKYRILIASRKLLTITYSDKYQVMGVWNRHYK